MSRGPGKPEAFSDGENARLRHVLRTMAKQHNWTQAEAGRRLGVSQQTAGNLMRMKNPGGFARPTALELARLCGFDSPERLLEDVGALADPSAAAPMAMREIAAGIARRHGFDERAIERVTGRYPEPQYDTRPIKWWLTRFGLEDQELMEERRVVEAAPPASTRVVEPPATKKPRRKRA